MHLLHGAPDPRKGVPGGRVGGWRSGPLNRNVLHPRGFHCWRAVEIPLQAIDPNLLQERGVFGLFDHFGNSEHVKLLRNGQQRAGQHLIVRIGVNVADELPVGGPSLIGVTFTLTSPVGRFPLVVSRGSCSYNIPRESPAPPR